MIVLLQVIHLAYGVISGFCTLKLASQPEITSQIEIITCSLSDPCVLYNKQVGTPQRCHPGSSTAASQACWCLTGKMQGWESSPHGPDSVKVALSNFFQCCLVGQGGLISSCNPNLSEESMNGSPCCLLFDVFCPHAPSRCDPWCFQREVPSAKPASFVTHCRQ